VLPLSDVLKGCLYGTVVVKPYSRPDMLLVSLGKPIFCKVLLSAFCMLLVQFVLVRTGFKRTGSRSSGLADDWLGQTGTTLFDSYLRWMPSSVYAIS